MDPGFLRSKVDSKPTRKLLHFYKPEKAGMEEQKAKGITQYSFDSLLRSQT